MGFVHRATMLSAHTASGGMQLVHKVTMPSAHTASGGMQLVHKVTMPSAHPASGGMQLARSCEHLAQPRTGSTLAPAAASHDK